MVLFLFQRLPSKGGPSLTRGVQSQVSCSQRLLQYQMIFIMQVWFLCLTDRIDNPSKERPPRSSRQQYPFISFCLVLSGHPFLFRQVFRKIILQLGGGGRLFGMFLELCQVRIGRHEWKRGTVTHATQVFATQHPKMALHAP